MRRPTRFVLPLFVLIVFLPSWAAAQGSQRLCSGGTKDGQPCASLDACPGGACVVVQGICNGGTDDGFDCDCPGSTCQSAPACPADPSSGTCAGGAFPGDCCFVEYNCSDGSPCTGTQKICLDGDFKGYGCLMDAHCGDGAHCGSTGRVCSGDGFSCVDDEDCISGTCQGASGSPTTTPSAGATNTPTPTPPPTATPTLGSPTPGVHCAGDCDGNGEVTVDNLIVMVNIALEVQAIGQCQAGDLNHDGAITVDEIIVAVNVALIGCVPV